ncbi:acyl-CoA dehydrogenase [Burkholderia stagnalis]
MPLNDYQAPLHDMRFLLKSMGGLVDGVVGADVVDAILNGASRLASEVLCPLNASGDREGATFHDGEVHSPKGFKDAYAMFVAGGWNSLSRAPSEGGEGLPRALSAMVSEMWDSANLSFSGCAALTRGAAEALARNGSDQLCDQYLSRLVSGEWTGTMNLTEPQAGSDLGAIRTQAVCQADGSYRITGQKIFITWGEHDMSENIVHLVLARTPAAPAGVKGISMFLVPKYLPDSEGRFEIRNAVRCVSIEHKLGLRASPTAVMAHEYATGWLIGEENRGLEYMFVMMNEARMSVGIEGVAMAERALQQAASFARDRIQGNDITRRSREPVAIIRHPDVRRMLMWMRSHTEAGRALACAVASAMDRIELDPDAEEKSELQSFVDLMTPVVKGWSTEMAVDVASMGIQVHGGMGFIEETGAAQYLRDARITPIYEGTTGIQANDLVGRKIARDGGESIGIVIADMRRTRDELRVIGSAENAVPRLDVSLNAIGQSLDVGISVLEDGVKFIVENYTDDPGRVVAGAVPFLRLFGTVSGGWQLARAALVAGSLLQRGEGDRQFLARKVRTAHFFADHAMPQVTGWLHALVHGAYTVLEFDEETE